VIDMLMPCESRPTCSLSAENDDSIMSSSSRSNSDSTLGGWRPASFAPTARPAAKDAASPLIDASPRRTRIHAYLTGESHPSTPTVTSPVDGAKGGLAGLFSSQPQSRTGRPATDVVSNEVRVETDRLVLRVLRLADFDDYLEVAADPDTFKYSHRGGMTSDEAWTRLLRQVGHWSTLGWGLFAVEEKSTGRFVGEVGLGDFRRGLGEDFDGVPEAGCTIAKWAQGLGYATEAMQGALDWIESKLAPSRTVCVIHGENRKSIRVAEKLGYREFARRSYRGFEAVLFERLRKRA
jgi:RimJ/RimL family protein N-acetyltransferase